VSDPDESAAAAPNPDALSLRVDAADATGQHSATGPGAARFAGNPPQMPEHPDVARWRMATPDDIDAIHAVCVAADLVDHPNWTTPRDEIADTFDLPHIDHSRDTILGEDAAGNVVAVGSAFLHPSRDEKLFVHLVGAVTPAMRRRGIGTAVLTWQRDRALEQLRDFSVGSTTPADLPAEIKLFAEEANTDHQRIAERAGFAPERWFTSMERDLRTAIATPPTPDGIRVVPFTRDRDDDARLARNDAFRDHWGSLPSAPETWAKFVGGEHFRPDLSRLAVDESGAIVAFCLASVNEQDWETLGVPHAYIDLIGVVRSHRRRGLAPLVVSHGLEAIAAADLERAVLDVDTASPTGANTLYVGLGFVATERSVALVRHL
jgi:mycothiol synthase